MGVYIIVQFPLLLRCIECISPNAANFQGRAEISAGIFRHTNFVPLINSPTTTTKDREQ